MKYAVIAALLATAQAAEPAGCKAGITTKIYSDKECSDDAHTTVTALESDVEKMNTCQVHKASADELEALEHSKAKLAEKEKLAATAVRKLGQEPDIESGEEKDQVPKIYKTEYPKIKAAYVANEATKTYIENYKKEANDEEDGDVDAYITAFDALAAEKAKENADAAKVKELTTALDAAAKKLDKAADVTKIQKSTAHQAAYDKEMEAVDTTHVANVESYLKKDVAVDNANAAVEEYKNVVTQAEEKIDAATYAGKMTCDAKGVKMQAWKEECGKGDVEDEVTAEWGKCTQAGKVWIKVTGAAALKAAAIALVALAGSQF